MFNKVRCQDRSSILERRPPGERPVVNVRFLFRPLLLVVFGLFPSLCLVPVCFPHDIITTNLTYTRDISRIFEKRCVACHGSGASIPLTSYAEVRPWAVDIKEQVLSRQMPPWGAVKGFGDLIHDNGLSQEELLIIAGWVVGGAPEGNPALLTPASKTAVPPPLPSLRDATLVTGSTQLPNALTVAGIRPVPKEVVPSARITATLPDGDVVPLLWLFQFDPRFAHAFCFRTPVELPRGTVITSDVPVPFYLQTQLPLPDRTTAADRN
jgi:hypothetical protein